MIKLPPDRQYDVMRPHPARPTFGTGVAAGALPLTPANVTLPGPNGNVILRNHAEVDAVLKIADVLKKQPEGSRRKILHELEKKLKDDRKFVATELLQNTTALDRLRQERENLEAFQAATIDLLRWQKAGLRMERPTGSVMHHLLDAMAEKQVRLLFAEAAGLPGDFKTGHLVGQGTHAFVVEHDWAAVFEGATEFSGDDFRLPYDSMCFEFRIGGMNICAMITSNGERKLLAPFVDTRYGWVLPKFAYLQNGAEAWRPTTSLAEPGDDEFEPLRSLICRQIRAICISLEAEVSTTEVIRASFKLNRSREKRGRAPVADYHVIRLAHRHRVLPRSDDDHAEPGTRKRLHFRRGHYRHFTTHKTWIFWTLVGDPDLGFIDKHYRL